MARSFNNADSEYLERDGAVVSAYPFLLSCWFNPTDLALWHDMVTLADKDATATYWRLEHTTGVAGGYLQAIARNGGSMYVAESANSVAAGTWQHGAAWFKSNTYRKVFLGYSDTGTNGGTCACSNIHVTSIGCVGDFTPSGYMLGGIAEAAIWNLTGYSDAEVDSLVKALSLGWTPAHFPRGLAGYWPLGGLYGQNDKDFLGSCDMTAYNTPSWTDHPGRLIYPGRPQVAAPGAAAGRVPWHPFFGRAA